MSQNLESTFIDDWIKFTKTIFPKSSSISSIKHMKTEIKELENELDSDIEDSNKIADEYADCIICLITSAGKHGFDGEEIIASIKRKINANERRKWKDNGDGTYSHIKQ